jgi:hypothetical protein
MPRAVRSQPDLEERIVQAEAKAAEACRNHDSTAEWECECLLYELYDERANLPAPPQRKPVEP